MNNVFLKRALNLLQITLSMKFFEFTFQLDGILSWVYKNFYPYGWSMGKNFQVRKTKKAPKIDISLNWSRLRNFSQ